MKPLLFSLCIFTSSAVGMDSNKWSEYDNEWKYATGVALIDKEMKSQEFQFNTFLENKANAIGESPIAYFIFKERLQGYKKFFEKKLQKIEDDLKKEEDLLLFKICEEFDKTSKLGDLKQKIKENTDLKFSTYLHNFDQQCSQQQAFPEATVSYFKEKGINLLNIEIKKENIENHKNNACTIAAATYEEKPIIVLCDAFYDRKQMPLGVLEHELAHLLLMHNPKEFAIRDLISWNAISKNCSVASGKRFEDSQYFDEFKTLCEKQANILHKSPEGLMAIRANTSKHFYPGHLYASHYAQVAQVHEIHKRLDLIQKLEQHVRIPIPKIAKARIEIE